MFIQQRSGGGLYDHGSLMPQRPPGRRDICHMFLGCRVKINGGMSQRGRLQLGLRLELSSVPSDPRMEWVLSRVSKIQVTEGNQAEAK